MTPLVTRPAHQTEPTYLHTTNQLTAHRQSPPHPHDTPSHARSLPTLLPGTALHRLLNSPPLRSDGPSRVSSHADPTGLLEAPPGRLRVRSLRQPMPCPIFPTDNPSRISFLATDKPGLLLVVAKHLRQALSVRNSSDSSVHNLPGPVRHLESAPLSSDIPGPVLTTPTSQVATSPLSSTSQVASNHSTP